MSTHIIFYGTNYTRWIVVIYNSYLGSTPIESVGKTYWNNKKVLACGTSARSFIPVRRCPHLTNPPSPSLRTSFMDDTLQIRWSGSCLRISTPLGLLYLYLNESISVYSLWPFGNRTWYHHAWTTIWKTPLIRCSAREYAVALGLEWRFRNSEISITNAGRLAGLIGWSYNQNTSFSGVRVSWNLFQLKLLVIDWLIDWLWVGGWLIDLIDLLHFIDCSRQSKVDVSKSA